MPKEREVRNVLSRLQMLVVPTSKHEIPIGTYRNIAKTAGWL